MPVVVDSVDAALCLSCACANGINVGLAGSELYLSDLIANNTLPADSLVNNCLSISGTLHIDVNYQLSNLEVKMNPYSTVIIDENIQLLMHDVHVHGCDTMWQSWVASPFVYLNAKRCNIEDGIVALRIEPDALVILDSVHFHANDIGILLNDADANSTAMNYSSHYLSNCRFDCTGDYLLPPYAMQTISRCGISANNHQLDLIDYNEFYDMLNGVVGVNADMTILGCRFKNIRHNDQSLASSAGYAIHSDNQIMCSLTVDGAISSIAAPDDLNMNNCRVGISLKKANLSCTANKMLNMTRGIEITESSGAYVKIVENNMQCRQQGILVYNSMPFTQFYIVKNEIGVHSPFPIGALAAFGGIIIQGNGVNIDASSNGIFNIIDNNIALDNTRYGILVSSCTGVAITDNTIQLNQITPLRGIMLRQVNKSKLNCNVVNGLGQDVQNNALNSTYWPAAYEFVNSPSSDFRCNSSNRIYTGMAMFNNCNGSRIRANLFYRNKYGLYYGTNANGSPQYLHGNIFDIDTLTGNRFGAYNVNISANNYVINKYTVNPSTNPQFDPLRIGRNNGAMIFSANQTNYWTSNGWFDQNPGPNFKCSDESIDCTDDIYRFTDLPDSSFNYTPLLNLADSIIYGWDAARYFTELILNDSTLLQDSLFNAYYNSLSGTSVVQFSEVSRHISRAYILSSSDSLALYAINTAYAITYTAYRHVDSLVRVQGAGGPMQAQRDSLRNALRMHRAGLNQLHTYIDSLRTLKLDSIEQLNEQLQNGTLQALNEKAVNQLSIRLNKYGKFTTSEASLLYFIAMQCPYSGGASVYTARSLYTVVNDTLDFNDIVLCENEDWNFRKEENKLYGLHKINIFPNPANKVVYVIGLIQDDINSIEIINNLGIRLTQKTSTANNTALDVAEYPNGIYYIRVSNSECVETFKVNINR